MEGAPSKNPNKIADPSIFPQQLPVGVHMKSENVYRSVQERAVDDLVETGVVRNAASAGYGGKHGDRVWWSKGVDGKHHTIQEGHVLYEAPHAIASERAIEHSDLLGVYKKDESGQVVNELEEVRKRLGLNKEK